MKEWVIINSPVSHLTNDFYVHGGRVKEVGGRGRYAF